MLSPIDGHILRIVQESETAIGAGAVLPELADTVDLEIAVGIPTRDAVAIRPGTKVAIHRWGGLAALEGRVRWVEPSGFTKVSALGVDEQRVWFMLDITSSREQWAALGDGNRIDVRIVVVEIERAIAVPVGAHFRRGDKWPVSVAESSRARIRRVDVARRSGRHAAIASGLSTGVVVVMYPPSSLANGSAARTR